MVMSSLDFQIKAPNSRVNALVTQLSQVESSLDSVARDIDSYGNTQKNIGITLSLKYKKLIDLERKLSEQWSVIFESLLNFVPRTHKETSEAMVALVDLQLKGHDSEQVMKALRRLALEFKQCE